MKNVALINVVKILRSNNVLILIIRNYFLEYPNHDRFYHFICLFSTCKDKIESSNICSYLMANSLLMK